ncbi:MAG: hypothetical protein P0Y65_20700 [Candidatus Devosia phytovorans]|uniref:Uncharacterized protein n=1 Tax=Candidatus Devosia phytovorans TaxID=3121372 RepID=A0AAJ5VW22_9HYPH|nr:hypothetical protein [Devosia sp.]WEK04562.1 MAG: hypothetical protein P0Y65_20700 [Devosia sp.]
MHRTSYLVADGVEWVDGKPVPANRRMSLTDAEALYDLAQGRIALPPPRQPRKPRIKAAT